MEIVKVDPTEFGLKESNGADVEAKFSSAIAESEALKSMYEVLVTKELTPELAKEAKELRNKLVKVRTSISRIHKVEKAFFLASGKYVDAWKNRNIEPIQIREEKLMEIEKYEETLEKAKIKALEDERVVELKLHGVIDADIPERLGTWGVNIWSNYLAGVKSQNEESAEIERRVAKKAEAVRQKRDLHESRKNQLISYFPFMDVEDSIKAKELGELSIEDYSALREKLIKAKDDDAKNRALQIAENEKLKAAAVQRKIDDEARDKKIEEERLEGIKKFEASEKIRIAKEQEETAKRDAELNAEQEAKEKAENELQAIKDAEIKKEADRLEAIQNDLNKGDEAKVEDLIEELKHISSKHTFTSEKNAKMYANVIQLIAKIITYIQK